jgi:hypothetical protein
MGPIGYPETSLNDYHSTLRNITEEHRSATSQKFKMMTTDLQVFVLTLQNMRYEDHGIAVEADLSSV